MIFVICHKINQPIMKYRITLLSIIFISYNYSFSQEHETHTIEEKAHEVVEDSHQEPHQEEHDTGHHKKHAISVVISHTHIKSGVKNNSGDNWIALPSFGLNYNYSINEKWAIGLHNDIIVEEFIVEDPNAHGSDVLLHKNEDAEIEGIERGRPIASAVMITYKPFKHIAFLAGGGMEFSKHENFALIRLGIEFPFHIPNDWEIFGATAFDINIDAYNGFTFGFGIAKLF